MVGVSSWLSFSTNQKGVPHKQAPRSLAPPPPVLAARCRHVVPVACCTACGGKVVLWNRSCGHGVSGSMGPKCKKRGAGRPWGPTTHPWIGTSGYLPSTFCVPMVHVGCDFSGTHLPRATWLDPQTLTSHSERRWRKAAMIWVK